MTIRPVNQNEKKQFNLVATHPLQSWEWGEFRQKTGLKVIRLGAFDHGKLKAALQLTIHPLPHLPFNLIYFPKGPKPTQPMLKALKKIGQQEKAILIKLEPNIHSQPKISQFLLTHGCRPGRPLFTRYTFQLDLTKTEQQLLTAMKAKTRYNIKLSQRHQVKIIEDNSQRAFEIYLKLMMETTKRQGFYAHTAAYHRQLWQTLAPTGIYHLFLAQYQGQTLAAYVFFVFNHVLYYPYGASTRSHREVMAPYALFWQAIKFGQKQGCHTFDMWGSLGPHPNPQNPWFGFHRFKQGFGAQLIEFTGTYDLVTNQLLYYPFKTADWLRGQFLKIKAHHQS